MISPYGYKAVVFNCKDGDTVDAKVSLGFHVYLDLVLRFASVDTPELNSSNIQLRTIAKKADARVRELLVDPNILMQSFKPYKTDKYGRWVALIINSVAVNVNQTLLDEHLGVPTDEDGRRLIPFEDLIPFHF